MVGADVAETRDKHKKVKVGKQKALCMDSAWHNWQSATIFKELLTPKAFELEMTLHKFR